MMSRNPAPPRQPSPIGYAIIATARALGRWRLELATLTATILIIGNAYTGISPIAQTATLALAAGITAFLITIAVLDRALLAPITAPPRRRLRHARIRRHWQNAAQHAGCTSRVARIEPSPVGEALTIKVTDKTTVKDLDTQAGRIATRLAGHPLATQPKIREVNVNTIRQDPSRARVLLVRRDPFDDPRPVPWPNEHATQLRFDDPIPFAVDIEGRPIPVDLSNGHLLIGGATGAGKSIAFRPLLASAALDPHAQLWLLDGKEIEFTAWAPAATQYSDANLTAAKKLLAALDDEMTGRYQQIKSGAMTAHDFPRIVLAVDEIAIYLNTASTTKQDGSNIKAIAEHMRRIISLGRAARITIIAATQQPDADTIPTQIRNIFTDRFALRCSTSQMSDMILGPWAGKDQGGYDASKIVGQGDDPNLPGGQPGVGYLLTGGRRPRRVRGVFVTNQGVEAIVSRVVGLRLDAGLDGVEASVWGSDA